MSEKNEFRLCVPADMARRFKGLSFDIGNSVAKFVYKSKEDKEELNSSDGEYGHFHLVSFPLRELSTALNYVRQNAAITREDGETERPTVCTTGVGCTQHGKLICDALDVKLQQLTEFDCFVKSFTYLASRMPRSEFLEPFLDEAITGVVEKAKKRYAMIKKMIDLGMSNAVDTNENAFMAGFELATGKPREADLPARNLPFMEVNPDIYPCLLAMCGSGFVFYKVDRDGSFKIVDQSNRGGRTFHGLGKQLTGYRTFSELIEAASKGSQRGLDQFNDELVRNLACADGDDSMYNMFAAHAQESPDLSFCFGKAVDSVTGEFKREDLACALLNCHVLDLVQSVQLISHCHSVKHIFFSGGYCSSPLVRSIITTEYAKRNLILLSLGLSGPFVPIDFIKPGLHLGALGCVIQDVEQSTSA